MEFRKKDSLYGPCGIYCGACGANDCAGCLSDDIDEYVKNCKFRQCTMEKKIDFCCFCSEYPCNELHVFMNDKWPHHWTMEPNLKFIKENGMGKWLLKMEEEWTCHDCGTGIKWYLKECSCGRKLDAWDVPD